MRKGILTCGLALTLLAAAPAWSAIIVDDFDGAVLGGSRDLTVDIDVQPIPSLTVSASVASGMLLINSDAATDGKVHLMYGSGGSPLNADFAGQTDIEIDLVFVDLTPLTISFDIDGETGSTMVVTPIAFGAPQTVTLSLAGVSGLDDVDIIKITFDPPTAGDVIVDQIRVVPEPASLAIAALGGALVLAGRRR